MAKVKDKLENFIEEKIINERLEDIIGERFGRYSKYIIQERAIPDVRDGLKPVQRRILYAMYAMRIFSNSPFKKSARITGEVMGKYHPHGDSSIYEAMVRMSQDWKMGVKLIEMHGNNGSIDGDGPAAMRYTEARLNKNAEYLLRDIDKKTVNFAPNFDDEELEPTVLPAKFPNILVNGSQGISAGYATNIPPHNLKEVIEATIHRIDYPQMRIDTLMTIMQGPDFPTGGIVQGIDGIKQAFETGRGKIVVRAKIELEDMGSSQKRIVVTEIPFDVNKANIVKKIDQMRIDKIVEDIAEVRDETNREGLRIAIDLKKGANIEAIITYLLKNTDLQISYNYNMVAICNNRPMTMGVLDILDAYIEHQKDIITNRCNYELEKAQKRVHIVLGLIKMVDVLEEVIATIRQSKGKADSKTNIMEKFGFTELQAEAIVTLQLYRLSSTDINALIEENKELEETIKYLEIILADEKELLKVIKTELREISKVIGTERKTIIEHEIEKLELDSKELIPKEDVYVNITKDGYIKRSNIRSYQSSKTTGLKDGDATIFCKLISTLDTILVFTSKGNYYFIPVYTIDDYKWKDLGTHLSTFAPLLPNEIVVNVFSIDSFQKEKTLLLCTKKGAIQQVALSSLEVTRYSKTIRVMKIANDDDIISVDMTDNPLEIVIVSHHADVLRFRANEVALCKGASMGMKSMLIKHVDKIVGAFYSNQKEDIILFTSRGTIKRMKLTEIPLSKRSRTGFGVIRMQKTNPYLIISASAFTPNQYKENVMVNTIYTKGAMAIEAFDLKYNVSDFGKSYLNAELGEPYRIYVDKPENKDAFVDGSYLIIEQDKPEVIKEKKEVKKMNLIDDLDQILSNEKIKEKKVEVKQEKNSSSVVHSKEEKNDELPKTIIYRKVSLFDEE